MLTLRVAMEKPPIAAIFIDLQQGFTKGQWMQHFGEDEVAPIKKAFDRASNILPRLIPLCQTENKLHLLMSQVPFPLQKDFDFIPAVGEIVEANTSCVTGVIKPGNNILHGIGSRSLAAEWCQGVVNQGVKTVVIGGCTLTSCVRVSAVEIQRKFACQGLQTVVDLSLCGARSSNYIKRCKVCLDHYLMGIDHDPCEECGKGHDVKSPVDLAVENMLQAGVQVVQNFVWDNLVKSST